MRLVGLGRSVFATIAIAMVVVACGDDDKPVPKSTVQEMLDECTPFNSFDFRSELDFDTGDRIVKLRRVSNSSKNKSDDTIDTAHDFQEQSGTFKIDEMNHLVHVEMEGVTSTFVMSEPGDGLQCVLIDGTPESANLTLSWFGTSVPPEEPPDRN
jgi:hypothetical protein